MALLGQVQAIPLSPRADENDLADVVRNFVGKIIDTRVVESVKLFTGQESEWRQWSVDFRAAVTNFGLDDVMDRCENTSDAECLRINCDDKNKLMSKALYICLTNRIETGKASEILDKPGRNSEGYLCWKLLKNEYCLLYTSPSPRD